jgi:hypothetical protein
MRSIFVFFLLLFTGSVYSQFIEIKGVVIDSITLQPVAYANVGVSKLGLGTITNQQGNFKLRLPANSVKLTAEIQILGYQTYTFPIVKNQQYRTYKLVPLPTELSEAVVFPRDTLLNMLRLAYWAIPKNYPTQPIMQTGFYRAVQKANDTLYLNFIEAILDVYKGSYKHPSSLGQIRLVKSRKNIFPGLDTINNVRFYGGPHFPNDLDLVFKRKGYINPKHFKDYYYWLTEQKQMGSGKVYCIEFKDKNDSIFGTIYLDKKTLAYTGFEVFKKKEEQSSRNNFKFIDKHYKVGYQEMNGKWYLSYIIHEATGLNIGLNRKVSLHNEYLTTSTKTDSVQPIPFNQEFAAMDIISIKADDYSQTSWTDFNILEQDSVLAAQDSYSIDQSRKILEKKEAVQKSWRDVTYTILSRISGDIGLGSQIVKNQGGVYGVYYQDDKSNGLKANETVTSSSNSLSLYIKMAYHFQKRWGVYYASNNSLSSSQAYENHDFGFQYRTPIFTNSRKWFAEMGVAYSNARYNLQLGNADKTGGSISIDGKTFDAYKIEIQWGSHLTGLKPSLSVQYKIGKTTYLFANVSTLFEFSSEDQITFKEKSGFFLTRKTERLPLDDQQLQLSIDEVPTVQSHIKAQPYQFNFGLSFRF